MKQNTIRRFISLAMLFVLVILFSATSDYFLQAKNIISIFRDASVIGIIGNVSYSTKIPPWFFIYDNCYTVPYHL